MHDARDGSPWTVVLRFEKRKRLLDLLHIVHQGVLRDFIASSLLDAMEDGSLAHFYGVQNPDAILHAVGMLGCNFQLGS